MLSLFDANPSLQEALVFAAIAGAFALVALAWRARAADRPGGVDWAWTLAILLVLLAGRWPTWTFGRELNQDESQLIAGAITLRHDPAFWRSVDGGTAGPLGFFVLLPVGTLLGADGYLSARLTAWLLLGGALIAVHHALLPVAGRAIARAVGFAPLVMEACTWERSFLHYSSELVALPLIATAILLGVRRFQAGADWRWNFAGGLLLGALPFAKLQAAPMGLFIGAAWIAAELAWQPPAEAGKNRGVTALVTGALLPALICALYLTGQHLWSDALVSYYLHNTRYIEAGSISSDLFLTLWLYSIVGHTLVHPWLIASLVVLLATAPLAWRATDRRSGWLALAAVGLVATALLCIVAPGRPFLHYWQLLLIPWTLLLGVGGARAMASLAVSDRRRAFVLAALVLIPGGAVVYGRVGLPQRFLGSEARRQSREPTLLTPVLQKLAGRGEAITVWGWMNGYYVEGGYRQGTRNAQSEAILSDRGYQTYFRARYLADLARNQPVVFVDVAAPGSFLFNTPASRHDAVFPELAAYVEEHYTFTAEIRGNRVYVRRDRLEELLKKAREAAPAH